MLVHKTYLSLEFVKFVWRWPNVGAMLYIWCQRLANCPTILQPYFNVGPTLSCSGKTVPRHGFWRQFLDRFENSSPTLLRTVPPQKGKSKVQGMPQSQKKVREKTRECHNHKPQPFPDHKRKRKPTNPNKHKSNKRTKSTKTSSLFPKRGNRNTKRTEKHKNKMTHGKTYNKSPRRMNHKATKSKTNTGTTAFERSVE